MMQLSIDIDIIKQYPKKLNPAIWMWTWEIFVKKHCIQIQK